MNELAKIKIIFKEFLVRINVTKLLSEDLKELPGQQKSEIIFETVLCDMIQFSLINSDVLSLTYSVMKLGNNQSTISVSELFVLLILFQENPIQICEDSYLETEKRYPRSKGLSYGEFLKWFENSKLDLENAVEKMNGPKNNDVMKSILKFKKQWPILRNYFIKKFAKKNNAICQKSCLFFGERNDIFCRRFY